MKSFKVLALLFVAITIFACVNNGTTIDYLKDGEGAVSLSITFGSDINIDEIKEIIVTAYNEEGQTEKTSEIPEILASISYEFYPLPLEEDLTIEVVVMDAANNIICSETNLVLLSKDEKIKELEITFTLNGGGGGGGDGGDDVDDDGDGYSENEGDCDDTDADISPDAEELCDEIDNNCDDEIDNAEDVDDDGFNACEDCDDDDADVNPDVEELYEDGTCVDGIDNNCDGEVDEDKNCVQLLKYYNSQSSDYLLSTAPKDDSYLEEVVDYDHGIISRIPFEDSVELYEIALELSIANTLEFVSTLLDSTFVATCLFIKLSVDTPQEGYNPDVSCTNDSWDELAAFICGNVPDAEEVCNTGGYFDHMYLTDPELKDSIMEIADGNIIDVNPIGYIFPYDDSECVNESTLPFTKYYKLDVDFFDFTVAIDEDEIDYLLLEEYVEAAPIGCIYPSSLLDN